MSKQQPVQRTILIVVDDPNGRKYLRLALACAGHRTLEADCGQASLEVLGHERIDLVLLDVMMPDMDLLARVIENLLGNALRLSQPGGDVVLSAERGADGTTTVTVADRGPGVPAELRERIFDKYVTGGGASVARSVNYALGLTFCKVVVAAHGGRIWVEPREGGGSCFRFTLPPAGVEATTSPELAGVGAAG